MDLHVYVVSAKRHELKWICLCYLWSKRYFVYLDLIVKHIPYKLLFLSFNMHKKIKQKLLGMVNLIFSLLEFHKVPTNQLEFVCICY